MKARVQCRHCRTVIALNPDRVTIVPTLDTVTYHCHICHHDIAHPVTFAQVRLLADAGATIPTPTDPRTLLA